MISRQQFLLSVVTFVMMGSVAHAQSTDVVDPLKTVPCTIEEIFAKHTAAAEREADALRDQKKQELVDPQNRADRAKPRLEKHDENSWEGGTTSHRVAFDVPKIRMRRVTFSFPETFLGETRIRIPDGAEQCWVPIPFGKTLVPCGVHYRDAIVTVPQFRTKTISLDLPDAVEWQPIEASYDTPTLTIRDNRRELNTAESNIKSIKRELEESSNAIIEHHKTAGFDDADKAIKKVEQSVLADFDKQLQDQLAPFAKIRADLEAQRKAARANAGDKVGEVDSAFAKVIVPINLAEAAAHAKADANRKDIMQQFADLHEDVKKSRLSCVKNS